MNLEQMKARLAELVAQLEGFKAVEITEEVVAEIEGLKSEFEGLKAKISAKESVDSMLASATKSERQVAPKAAVKVEVAARKFQNSGEFFKAVKNASNGRADERLLAASHLDSNIGEEGGFLLPDDIRQDIQKKIEGDMSLLPMTTQLSTSSNSVVLPTKENAAWDTSFVQAYWTAECATIPSSKFNMGQSRIELHKLASIVNVSDEMLSDANLLESFIKKEAPEAILHKINEAIISGNGVGKPQGFLNSGFKYEVAKENAQTASTVVYNNIVKMWARLTPSSAAKAVWLVNPAVLGQLPLMKFDAAAASPVPVYLPAQGLASAPYGTLLGRPVFPMLGAVSALGTAGDISLVDLSYLTTITKTNGIKEQMSIHAQWDKDLVSFKFTMRIGGQCLFKSPITTQNGAYSMSGFVTLADRL